MAEIVNWRTRLQKTHLKVTNTHSVLEHNYIQPWENPTFSFTLHAVVNGGEWIIEGDESSLDYMHPSFLQIAFICIYSSLAIYGQGHVESRERVGKITERVRVWIIHPSTLTVTVWASSNYTLLWAEWLGGTHTKRNTFVRLIRYISHLWISMMC